jgi:hypothetical protein
MNRRGRSQLDSLAGHTVLGCGTRRVISRAVESAPALFFHWFAMIVAESVVQPRNAARSAGTSRFNRERKPSICFMADSGHNDFRDGERAWARSMIRRR